MLLLLDHNDCVETPYACVHMWPVNFGWRPTESQPPSCVSQRHALCDCALHRRRFLEAPSGARFPEGPGCLPDGTQPTEAAADCKQADLVFSRCWGRHLYLEAGQRGRFMNDIFEGPGFCIFKWNWVTGGPSFSIRALGGLQICRGVLLSGQLQMPCALTS